MHKVRCTHCGADFFATERNCPACGTPTPRPAAAPAQPPAAPRPGGATFATPDGPRAPSAGRQTPWIEITPNTPLAQQPHLRMGCEYETREQSSGCSLFLWWFMFGWLGFLLKRASEAHFADTTWFGAPAQLAGGIAKIAGRCPRCGRNVICTIVEPGAWHSLRTSRVVTVGVIAVFPAFLAVFGFLSGGQGSTAAGLIGLVLLVPLVIVGIRIASSQIRHVHVDRPKYGSFGHGDHQAIYKHHVQAYLRPNPVAPAAIEPPPGPQQ